MLLYVKSFLSDYSVFSGLRATPLLCSFCKVIFSKEDQPSLSSVGWFSKGGIEEKEGENILPFSFLTNMSLTEHKVKFRGLILVFLLEKDP